MKLRKELEPIRRNEEFKNLIRSKIEHIESLLESKIGVKKEIEDFNKLTERDYDEVFFKTYWNSISIEEFINQACNPQPKKDSNITKEELIELVKRIKDYETYAEESDFYLELLEANVLMPDVPNLIFWSKEQLSAEEIVEKALNYKPIIL